MCAEDFRMAKKVKLSVYGMQIKRNGTESQDLNNLCEGILMSMKITQKMKVFLHLRG